MKKTVTLMDIAKKCKTSNVTVSKALAGKEGVSGELRKKIIKTANEMGYVAPKHIASKKGINIEILIPRRFINPGGSFYWALYNKLVKKLKRKNYFCILEILEPEDEKALVLPRMLSEKKIKVLISLGQTSESYARLLADNVDCMVLLDYYVTGLDLDGVVTNGYNGGYKITKHLISMGHKKIGYIGSLFATTSIFDRYMGFYKAMFEHGLEIKKEWTISDRDGEDFIDLDFPDVLPTAFVCNCDEVAFRVIRQLKNMGIKVPEDISIVGYDNYIISEMCEPTITTIAIDSDAMADETVYLIERRLRAPGCPPYVKSLEGIILSKESVKKLN